MTDSLSGQSAVVVGGSSGIGRATAARLRDLGASVTIVGRSKERLAKAHEILGADVVTASVDCTDEPATATFFEGLESVDHLVVSVAANAAMGMFVDVPVQGFHDTFDGRFWPYLIAMHHGAKRLSKVPASTVTVSACARSTANGLMASAGPVAPCLLRVTV